MPSAIAKNENWSFTIQVYDGQDYSIEYISANITIQNLLPTGTNFEVEISSPKTTDDLVATWDYSDVDNDPIDPLNNVRITWYNNSTPVPLLENYTAITSEYTTKGEVWIYEVEVWDGTDWSDPDSPVGGRLIFNSKPTVDNPVLSGGSTTNEDITVDYTFLDADNDTEGSTTIEWFVNLVYVGVGGTLDSSDFKAGDTGKD